MALIDVSYSLVQAVRWPRASRFGTAVGLMGKVQNSGIRGTNLAAGWLCAFALGFTAGRRRHEIKGEA